MNAKRRLTTQQQTRISQRQRAHSTEHTATVIAHLGRKLICETDDKQQYTCHLRQNLPPIVVGDTVVIIKAKQNQMVIAALSTRRNLLYRHTKRGKYKPIAANIDLMFVVCAVVPTPSFASLDRYLALAHYLNITPIIVFNKIDLLTEETKPLKEALAYYETLAYTVLALSCEQKIDLAAIPTLLQHKTGIVVGQSGVGKSSILQQLLPHENIEIANVSEQTRATGVHTTTTAKLYALGEEAHIIDSPGVRAFDVKLENVQDLQAGFIDIAQAAIDCAYRNCKHLEEPDCGVKHAVAHGNIPERRLKNFHEMLKNI